MFYADTMDAAGSVRNECFYNCGNSSYSVDGPTDHMGGMHRTMNATLTPTSTTGMFRTRYQNA